MREYFSSALEKQDTNNNVDEISVLARISRTEAKYLCALQSWWEADMIFS